MQELAIRSRRDNRNNLLNARIWGSQAGAPAVHFNEYGGTVGGPVWIPKLWNGREKKSFFFSYDGIRNNAPVNTGYMWLPSAAERTGDFSKSFQVTSGTTYPITVYDANMEDSKGNRQPFPNDQIPDTRIFRSPRRYSFDECIGD